MNIGTISIVTLTIGITQACKEIFGITGKKNQIVALVVGTILTGVAYSITNGLISESYIPAINIVVTSLAGGLSAIGFFDITTKELPKALKYFVDMIE